MPTENELIRKLMVSKAIMEKHNEIPRTGNSSGAINSPMVESFNAPESKYNLPTEFLEESTPKKMVNTEVPTTDRIMSSKLPDEIKRLMIEHPITPSNPMVGPTLSNDLIDKAARLMNVDASGKQTGETPNRKPQRQNVLESVSETSNIRSLLKEVIEEVLLENGILSESTQKTNDVFSFKVGKHIFEGKVTKIKKIK
jgi:hypothetical protein